MPSTMIHLWAAREAEHCAPPLYWVGAFAPDYTEERTLKDAIHLRGGGDREAALEELRGRIRLEDAFERGWLMHLYTDARWDAEFIPAYREAHLALGRGGEWFAGYRGEIGLASFYIHHNLPWTAEVWAAIISADFGAIRTELPVDGAALGPYCARKHDVHRNSDPASVPEIMSYERLERFARETGAGFRAWVK